MDARLISATVHVNIVLVPRLGIMDQTGAQEHGHGHAEVAAANPQRMACGVAVLAAPPNSFRSPDSKKCIFF